MLNKIPYRADIDGLRAVAVILVVLFHFGLGVPSGFVGVDVFFVISGYLIGSKIIPEIQEGRFSFKLFWGSRFKRLFPAAAVMSIFTIVLAWFIILPDDYSKLGQSSLAHFFFSSNIFFWKNTHYFTESVSSFPLLHTWSLSVEEQFYLLLPILLYWASKFGLRPLRILFLITIIISIALCFYASRHYQTPNYYLLPTRWWELGVGLLIPLFGINKRLSARLGGVFLIIGLGMILLAAYVTPSDNFPSEWTLLPVSGTLLCIIGGVGESKVKQIFSLRPMVLTGLISYSLYLWHWPIHSFLSYIELGGFIYNDGYRLLGVGVSFILAFLSWKYVEKRYRYSDLSKKKSSIELSFLVATLLLISGLCMYSMGFTARLPSAANQMLLSKSPSKGIMIEQTLPKSRDRYHQLGNEKSEGVRVCLWGDSHAAPYLPLFKELGEQGMIKGFAALCASTPPILDYIPTHFYSLRGQAPDYNREVLSKLIDDQIEVVFLAAIWNVHFGIKEQPDVVTYFYKTVAAIEDAGIKVVVIKQAPRAVGNSPRVQAFRNWQNLKEPKLISSKEYLSTIQFDIFNGLLSDEQIIGVGDSLLTSKGFYKCIDNGYSCYYDDQHLSKWGGKLLKKQLILTLAKHTQK